MLSVTYITNKLFNSRTYILSSEAFKYVWLVDCGDIDTICELVGHKSVRGVLLTHTHSDHIYGLNMLLDRFPDVMVYTNDYGAEALKFPKLNLSRYHSAISDIVVDSPKNVLEIHDGDSIDVFGNLMYVLETPGHDPSCVSFIFDQMVFTGDSYIPGVDVFTGFPHSSRKQAEQSLMRLLMISENLLVMPGHTVMSKKNNYEYTFIQSLRKSV
ncbi:MAG: MBL fold metallo-hydrolase [Bacteroidales bacterium]|nr:MBL fold metallo-hydrolase [Bacteroidales bacterium]